MMKSGKTCELLSLISEWRVEKFDSPLKQREDSRVVQTSEPESLPFLGRLASKVPGLTNLISVSGGYC